MKTAFQVLLASALTFAAASAGPLTPPPGPVLPTNKTLQEVEPRTPIQSLAGTAASMYKITQPGAYYLTGNIDLAPDKNTAIEVGADGVTIDLNGFTLNGANADFSKAVRVEDGFFSDALRVHNGHITDWGTGIDGLGLYGAFFDNLRLTFNDSYGIDAGDKATISNCSAIVCGEGFYLRAGGTVSHSSAGFCGRGFDLGDGAALTNCHAQDCGDGFNANSNSTLTNCTAHFCQYGFIGNDGNLLTECNAQQADSAAFDFGERCHLSRCLAGLANLASQRGTSFSGSGIIVRARSTVENCTVAGVFGSGIVANENCTLRDNHVSDCGAVGIYITGPNTMVVANTVVRCRFDTGVLVEGDDCQIEENRVEGSGSEGIHVLSQRCLIIRNRVCASGRSNIGADDYLIGVGNYAGSILLPAAFTATLEPNANFTCGTVPPNAARPAATTPAAAPSHQPAPTKPGPRAHPQAAAPAPR